MKLTFYALTSTPPAIVPAEPTRRWMDEFPDQHAYRCLPLTIANCYGWCLLCPGAIEVTWKGGPGAADIAFHGDESFPWREHFVTSNFTHGIVTFHTGYLMRTEPGWHIYCSGPTNVPKDGIAPLSGVIETDWLPYPFTMNWHFTRPGTVRFEAGEPFCQVFPVKAHAVLDVVPEIRQIADDPPLLTEYHAGGRSGRSLWPSIGPTMPRRSSKRGNDFTSKVSTQIPAQPRPRT